MTSRRLLIVSTEPGAGKTTLCAGLARWIEGTGRRVGYLKPLTVPGPSDDRAAGDDDALVMRRLLRLEPSADELSPIWLDSELLGELLGDGESQRWLALVEAAARRQARRELLLIEGAGDWQYGMLAGLSVTQLAERLAARVLVVTRYGGLLTAERLLAVRAALGDRLIGAILNRVPSPALEQVRHILAPALERRGLPLLGAMPLETGLRVLGVNELVRRLSGQLLVSEGVETALVEQLVIGAMRPEAALTYFRQLTHKAVVTGGDRTDLQLAALETPTSCLVLTGNLYPSRVVIEQARRLAVPIVLVEHDTAGAVREIERLLMTARFRQLAMVERLMPMLEAAVDLPRLLALAGLGAADAAGRAPER